MELEHLLLKAATTVATDQGEFEAVISTATIDRERDIVDPEGFVRALQKWVPTGKRIPLAWNHSSKAEDQIGYIDPSTARVANGEVLARGWIDQTTTVGKDAWRMVKMGTLGFSFGYLVPQGGSSPRKGGGRHIRELDVFEVTATNAPMNGDTRVVGWKATVAPDGTMLDNTDDDATETPLKAIADAIEELQEFVTGEQVEGDSADVQQAERLITNLQALMRTEMGQGDDGKALRKRADELMLELAADGTEGKHPAPKPDELQEVKGELAILAAQLKELAEKSVEANEPNALTGADLRRKADELALEFVSDGTEPIESAPKPDQLQDVRDELAALAAQVKELAEAQEKAVDVTGKETESRSVDPLRAKADALILEFVSDGESLRKPPQQKVAPKPESEYTPEQIREIEREFTLIALTGDTES